MGRFLPSGFLAMTASLVVSAASREPSITWTVVLQFVAVNLFTVAFWLASRKVSQ